MTRPNKKKFILSELKQYKRSTQIIGILPVLPTGRTE